MNIVRITLITAAFTGCGMYAKLPTFDEMKQACTGFFNEPSYREKVFNSVQDSAKKVGSVVKEEAELLINASKNFATNADFRANFAECVKKACKDPRNNQAFIAHVAVASTVLVCIGYAGYAVSKRVYKKCFGSSDVDAQPARVQINIKN